jgi:hypothetical protein
MGSCQEGGILGVMVSGGSLDTSKGKSRGVGTGTRKSTEVVVSKTVREVNNSKAADGPATGGREVPGADPEPSIEERDGVLNSRRVGDKKGRGMPKVSREEGGRRCQGEARDGVTEEEEAVSEVAERSEDPT